MDLGSTSPKSDMISAEKYKGVDDAFIDVHNFRNTLSYHFSGGNKDVEGIDCALFCYIILTITYRTVMIWRLG